MLRVSREEASVNFYINNFGMEKVNEMIFDDFKLVFLAFPDPKSKHWTDREGILELTINYGDKTFAPWNGNEPPRGFGHICFTVQNIERTCSELEAKGVDFHKRLKDGSMSHIAFALDPDGYWIELIEENSTPSKFNHSMIRVVDISKSLHFFQDILGMKLIKISHHVEAEFSLYFLGYGDTTEGDSLKREGLVELTHNWRHAVDFEGYYNGNTEPKGFGHLAITVDDLDEACAYFESKKVKFQKRLSDGKMKDIAFILTPGEEYWIEVLQNESIKKRAQW